MATATKEAVLVSAVDLARQAAIECAENPAHVGEHLGVVFVGERLVSHQFACTAPGYRGWHWTVTLARVPRGRVATICESELLPGDDAILAPAWLPWSERLRPGDIGPGDILPFMADDPRLVPGYVPTGDEEQDRVAIEDLALARARVLSLQGRDRAAERWYAGSQGPTSPGALAASAACQTCGFIVPLSGLLGQVFGVCANEWSSDDGKVVSLDHGCGAHSETDLDPHASDWPEPGALFDDLDVELVSLLAEEPAAIPEVLEHAAQVEPGSADAQSRHVDPSKPSEPEPTEQPPAEPDSDEPQSRHVDPAKPEEPDEPDEPEHAESDEPEARHVDPAQPDGPDEPEHAAPEHAEPEHEGGQPDDDEPEHAAPEHAEPEHAAPEHAAPEPGDLDEPGSSEPSASPEP